MAGAVGLGAAIDFLAWLEQDALAAHEHEVLAYGIRALSEFPGSAIRVGPYPTPSCSIVAATSC